MSTDKHFLNEIGTSIIIDCGEDISTAAVYSIYYKKPSGTTGTWTAVLHTISAATNYLRHTIAAGELDETGEWEVQSYIELGNWKGRGDTARFTVYDNYS